MRNTIITVAFLCTVLVAHVQADHGALMEEELTPLDMENRKIKGAPAEKLKEIKVVLQTPPFGPAVFAMCDMTMKVAVDGLKMRPTDYHLTELQLMTLKKMMADNPEGNAVIYLGTGNYTMPSIKD